MHSDWQTWATYAIGAVALGYVAHRWWPRRAAASCGTPGAEPAACGSGCGGCGSAGATPQRDHRPALREQPVHLVRPPAPPSAQDPSTRS